MGVQELDEALGEQELEKDQEQDIGDGDDESDLDREHGQRRVRTMLDPKLPSEAEVKQHYLTHMPFRNWCPHCVRGRGKEMDHKKRDAEAHSMPEYHMDYCFPGDEDGQKLTVLTRSSRGTRR